MFSNCGAKSADGLHCGALILNTVFDLNLTNVIVENSTGYGLLGFNLLGKSSITNSVFRYNRATQDCIGGNAWIYYGNCPNRGTASSLIINSSQFLFGKVPITQSHSLGTGGLSFYIKCTNVSVNAANLTMYGNEGHYGGNLCIHFWLFTNISVTMENSYLGAGRGSRGGGVFVKIDPDVPVNDKYSCGDHSVLNQKSHQLVYFSNVTFDGNSAGNSGAGLEIEDFTPGYLCAVQLVMIDDSVFIYFPAHGMMEKLYVFVQILTQLWYMILVQGETFKQNSGTQSSRTTYLTTIYMPQYHYQLWVSNLMSMLHSPTALSWTTKLLEFRPYRLMWYLRETIHFKATAGFLVQG